jgi:hypothetical protein
LATKPNKGEQFESRVARVLMFEGAFVRRRVNLEDQFAERFTITDLDIMAFFISPTLGVTKVIGECKTTEARNSPSAGDRLMWSTGLASLVSADRAFIAISKKARPSERRLASLLDSEILDDADLLRREEVLEIGSDTYYGPQDPELNRLREAAKKLAKGDEHLRRLERFIGSELWLLPPVPALKKAFGACRRLSERWSARLPQEERRPIEWLTAESILGAILHLVQLGGAGYRQPEGVFSQTMHERFAEGLADYQSLRQISGQVDKVVTALLSRIGVDPTQAVGALGLFEPQPPAYLEPLTELVERLARQPKAAASIAQIADARYAEWLGADGKVEVPIETPEADRLLRLISTFMEGQIGIQGELLVPLKGTDSQTRQESQSVGSRPSPKEAGEAKEDLARGATQTSFDDSDASASQGSAAS